jgi:heme-degrading monooxygenase HmoA
MTPNFEPYYAVIFTSKRTEGDNGYAEMSVLMENLAKQQKGYLGLESARNEVGITVSYWKNLDAIKSWKQQTDHLIAQRKGRSDWYSWYKVRICKVERDYEYQL